MPSDDVLDMQEALERAAVLKDIEFRAAVLAQLAIIRTELEGLTGNGQPGRVGRLENKVWWHDRIIWMALGAVALVTFLSQVWKAVSNG